MEKLKRHTLNGSCFEWVSASDVEALEYAKREDEARIAELEKRAELFASLGHAWAVAIQGQNDQLQSQLTAEQQAHAETTKKLDETLEEALSQGSFLRSLLMKAIGELCFCREADKYQEAYQCEWHQALARESSRQASINRPTDNAPTDDRGEGEK